MFTWLKGSRELSPDMSRDCAAFLTVNVRLDVLKLDSLQRGREIDMALFVCGGLLGDWFMTSLVPPLAPFLIVGEELALYVILVLVDWVP